LLDSLLQESKLKLSDASQNQVKDNMRVLE